MPPADAGSPSLRIVYVWDADYPWDVRTEKVCAALTQAGHQVHIAARNRNRHPLLESLPEGTVHRMAPWSWAGGRLDALSGFPAFLNPRWISHIGGTARQSRTDVIIVRDLPLCPTSLWIGARLRVPVVFDMAENYPALLQDVWDTRRQQRFDVLLRNPRAARSLERYCVRRATRILVVIEESEQRLVRMGVPASRIDIVSNTPPVARLDVNAGRNWGASSDLTLVYLGLMELARGIDDLLEAMTFLRGASRRVRLRLIGGGRDGELLQRRACARGFEAPDVEFLGYIPSHEEALKLVAESDVGLIPHYANDWGNTTIPNKLFDYMAAGLPVVTSDTIPCARIVQEAGCGEVFRARDPRDLASAIVRLFDADLRRARGAAGRSAIHERFNWERDSGVLLEAIRKSLAASPRKETQIPPGSEPATR